MPIIDLTGQRFGRLTVVSRAENYVSPTGKSRHLRWDCICDCGNKCTVNGDFLKEGRTKSCGCLVSLTRANEANIVQGTNVGNIKRNTALPNSTTGIKGVHYSKTQGLYVATIGFQGKQYYLVFSTDINICINARKDAEKQIYSNFLEWYENRKKNRELN